MNLLKISTCALCLGTVLGVSSMAMEQNGEKCQQKVSEQAQILEINREKEEKNEKYLKFYNDLMTRGKLKEEDARKQAEIFEKELNKGKSFIYAQYYSMLRVVRKLDPEKAMLQAELFEREFNINKNFERSDYYATIMILCNLKAVRHARLEKTFRAYGESKEYVEKALRIIKKEVESNRGYFYTRQYICMLETGELNARRSAEMVEKELLKERSLTYATTYANLILDGQSEENARRVADIVEREEMAGRSFDYAIIYSSLILNGQSEENARKGAEIFKLEKGSLKYEEDDRFSGLYVRFYLTIRTEWNESRETAEKVARIMIGEVRAGREELYAKIYAKLVVIDREKENIARKKAEVVYNEMMNGKHYGYALKYAELITSGTPEAEARIKAEALMEIK